MGVSQAVILERLLEEWLVRRPGALAGAPAARLRRASELACPAAPRATLSCGAGALERLLPGGLPRGALVEVVGGSSSGRFSLAISALASVTSTGQAAALVDVGEHLDPEAAERAGVDLERLLWVRPPTVKQALAAAEILLSTGFPLVVADLGVVARTRFLPDAAWVRLVRSAQAHDASLLLSTPIRAGGIAADAVVSAGAMRPVWTGSGKAPRLLAGISSALTLEKRGRLTPGTRALLELSSLDSIAGAAPGREKSVSPAVPPRINPLRIRGPVPPTGRLLRLAGADRGRVS